MLSLRHNTSLIVAQKTITAMQITGVKTRRAEGNLVCNMVCKGNVGHRAENLHKIFGTTAAFMRCKYNK